MRFLLVVLGALTLTAGEHWPQFRGPGAMGVADDSRFPDKWSETENVAWKTAVPGVGWSFPQVALLERRALALRPHWLG